jgi:hypothetical protein
MQRVLVVTDDECIQVSCAEVLRSLGMEVTTGVESGGAPPDVVLLWDGLERDIRHVGATLPGVPLVVCTYDHRRPWPGTAAVVALPFDARRLASALASATAGRPRLSVVAPTARAVRPVSRAA